MPGRGRGNQRSAMTGPGSAPTPGDVKPEATIPATQPDAGEETLNGGTNGRGRGTQAAVGLKEPSEELVEKMKQSLGLKPNEAVENEGVRKPASIPKQAEATQSTRDVPTTFNPNAAPFVPSCKYDATTSHASGIPNQHPTHSFLQATPTTSWNVNAKAFVPGFTSVIPAEEVFEEEEEDYMGGAQGSDPYTVPVITRGFKDGLDEGGVALLNMGAEILINATLYPATFERLKHKLRNMLVYPIGLPGPQPLVLNKLCDMIILWAVRIPDFRIMASKICEILFEQKDVLRICLQSLKGFSPSLSVVTTEEEMQRLISFTMFIAEVFSRVRMDYQPIWVMGASICDYMRLLLDTNNEEAIYAVCNALKLTGSLLHMCTSHHTEVRAIKEVAVRLPVLMDRLKMLTISGTLSSRCVEVIKRVLSLHSHNWGQPMSPDTSLKENPPQIDSTESSDLPVTNPVEWDEYDGPEHSLEQPSYVAGHVASIDSDVEEEFEQFIEEIEDFLMKQDMGEPLDEEERG